MARPTIIEQNIRDSLKQKKNIIELMYRKAETYLNSIHKSSVIEGRQLLRDVRIIENEVKALEKELEEIMNPEKEVKEEKLIKKDHLSLESIFKKKIPTVISDIQQDQEFENMDYPEPIEGSIFKPMKVDELGNLRHLTDEEWNERRKPKEREEKQERYRPRIRRRKTG